MSSFLEPRLAPLASIWISSEDDFGEKKAALRRCSSFPGYTTFALQSHEERQPHAPLVDASADLEDVPQWPDTDTEDGFEQPRRLPVALPEEIDSQPAPECAPACSAWTLQTPFTPAAAGSFQVTGSKDCGYCMQSEALPDQSARAQAQFKHAQLRARVQLNLETELPLEPACNAKAPRMQVKDPVNGKGSSHARRPQAPGKSVGPMLMESRHGCDGTDAGGHRQVLQAVKAGNAALQKARAMMPAVSTKPLLHRYPGETRPMKGRQSEAKKF